MRREGRYYIALQQTSKLWCVRFRSHFFICSPLNARVGQHTGIGARAGRDAGAHARHCVGVRPLLCRHHGCELDVPLYHTRRVLNRRFIDRHIVVGLLVELEEGAARTGNCRLTDVLPDIAGAVIAATALLAFLRTAPHRTAPHRTIPCLYPDRSPTQHEARLYHPLRSRRQCLLAVL